MGNIMDVFSSGMVALSMDNLHMMESGRDSGTQHFLRRMAVNMSGPAADVKLPL